MFTFFLKEVRQLRRDTFFWGALGFQIMLSMLIVLVNLYEQRSLPVKMLYSPWFATLGFAAAFAIAIMTASRWNSEMNDDAMNPIVTTPLPPVMVVAGKYLATIVAILLPLAVAQIFVGFTIRPQLAKVHFACMLPTDAALVLLSAAILLVCASIFGKHNIIGVLIPGIIMILFMMSLREGLHEMNAPVLTEADGVKTILCGLVEIVLPIPLLFAITTAAVSVPSSDRAIPVRIVLVFTIAAYILCNYLEAPDRYERFQTAIYLLGGAVFSILAALAQRSAQTPRVMAAVRRLPPALRPLRILCSTGAIQELLFSLLFLAAALIAVKVDRPDAIKWARWGFAFIYATVLLCTAASLEIADVVKRIWNKRIHAVLLIFIAFAIFHVVFMVVLLECFADIETMDDAAAGSRIMWCTIGLGAASLGLLIPTAWEFVKSLKKRS